MPKIKSQIILLSLALPLWLSAAPYFCANNSAMYSNLAQCNITCGVICQDVLPSTTGTSGTCDTASYDGFVFLGGKTYAISKTTNFWDNYSGIATSKTVEINDVLKGLGSYYGGSPWIGLIDATSSTSYNIVDPVRFTWSDGSAISNQNWASGQPDNAMPVGDIGVTAVNGEHWGYIQSDGTWGDDGYHVSYGGDYKPKRKAIIEWTGPLSCVNGTPPPTTSNTTGYWCSDGVNNPVQCTVGGVPSSTSACTAPATFNSVTQKCESSYVATSSTAFGWDSCEGGNKNWSQSSTYCSGKGMRLASSTEVSARSGPVPSCGSMTWDGSPPAATCEAWNGASLSYLNCSGSTAATRCVGNVTTYTCPSGGTLSGTNCITSTAPSCPTGTALNTTTGACDAVSACTAPATWDSVTQQCVVAATPPGIISSWDSCDGGQRTYSSASSFCTSKSMRLPSLSETTASGGTIVTCPGGSPWTWTSTAAGAGQRYGWDGLSSAAINETPLLYPDTRCVSSTTTHTCSSGTLTPVCSSGVYNSTTKKCDISYAAVSGALTWDGCEGGVNNLGVGQTFCSNKNMRIPTKDETIPGGGTVPSCGGQNTWTTTNHTFYTFSGWSLWVWANGSLGQSTAWTNYGIRCVTNLSCPSGGTLSGTNCVGTVDPVWKCNSAGSCPVGMSLDSSTGKCATATICPLGNYTCTLINSSTIQNTDTTQGATDKTANGTTNSAGDCSGTVYLFNGLDNRCRPPGMQNGYSDCCQKGTAWFGISSCSQAEKNLGKLRDSGNLDGKCHYVGDYCSEKWPFIGCVQKKKTYCCFNGLLARIIQEQGRPQLGLGWGTPESPMCRGFKIDEFQKIDFSKIDLTEFTDKISATAAATISTNVGPAINSEIDRFKNSIK